MTDTDVASLLRFFKALAHESRLRLLGFVAQRERSVQELAGLLGLSEPTTSHHLALLHQTGLVILRVEGNLHWYAFEPSKLAPLAKSVLSRQEGARFDGTKAYQCRLPSTLRDRQSTRLNSSNA